MAEVGGCRLAVQGRGFDGRRVASIFVDALQRAREEDMQRTYKYFLLPSATKVVVWTAIPNISVPDNSAFTLSSAIRSIHYVVSHMR